MRDLSRLTEMNEDSLFLAAQTAIEKRYFKENAESALKDLINKELAKDGFKQVSASEIDISPYVADVRNDWDTLIVNVCNYGVWGYLDNRN